MNSDNLIDQLCTELKPAKPMPSPFALFLPLLVNLVLIITAGVWALSFRGDILEAAGSSIFWANIAWSLSVFSSSLLALVWLAYPGRAWRQSYGWALLGITFLSVGWHGEHLVHLPITEVNTGWHPMGLKCYGLVMGFALLSGSFVLTQIRRGASLHPSLSGTLVGLASISLGAVGVTLHCGIQNQAHITAFHFALPLFTGSLIGWLVGKHLLRW